VIAFERANEAVAALIEGAARLQAVVVMPASVLAQTWRGGPGSARLAKLIANSESDPLDKARAKEVGERLGNRGADDIADAHVVCCALERNAALVTADSDDMQALVEPGEELTVLSV
jgi:hypothetical protein